LYFKQAINFNKFRLKQTWPTPACEPHADLYPVSCSSNVNTVFIRVYVVNLCNLPIVYLEKWGATYTRITRKHAWWLVQAQTHTSAFTKRLGDVLVCPCVWCSSLR